MDDGKVQSRDAAGGGGVGVGGDERKPTSPSHDEALKKCLEENKGDHDKCKSQVNAFKYSSSTSSSVPMKPLIPLSLRSGLLTDV